MPYFTYEIPFSYADTGEDGRLSHRGTLRLLQEAAALASDRVGYGMKDVTVTRVAWMLTGWRLELRQRPQWPGVLTIHTWPRSLDGFFSDREFEIFFGGQPIALAASRWLLVNIDTGHAARITPEIAAAYDLDQRTVFSDPMPTAGRSEPAAQETFVHTVGRRDIDTNHHVNNLHYLEYGLEALPEAVWADLPNTVEILFRREIRLGTKIHCFYSLREGRHQVEICSDQSKTPHAFLWFYDRQDREKG